MKKIKTVMLETAWLLPFVVFLVATPRGLPEQTPSRDYPIRPVPFTQVQVDDIFWAPKMETNRAVTIPFALKKNEETGRVDNFRKAAGLMKGPHQGKRYNDSDVFKVMEGVAYTLMQEKARDTLPCPSNRKG